MPKFYFQLLDHAGVRPTEMPYDVKLLQPRSRMHELRCLRWRPTDCPPHNMLSVEVFDESKKTDQ